jgi:hypothetical protein
VLFSFDPAEIPDSKFRIFKENKPFLERDSVVAVSGFRNDF